MLETNAIQILQAAEMQATESRANSVASAAREFEVMLIESMLQQGGLLHGLEGGEDGGQTILNEWLTPLLARQLAEQFQLGLGEMMMKSLSAAPKET